MDIRVLDGVLDLSEALRVLLRDMGMAQRRFARLAGVSHTAVNRWCSRHAADRIVPPRSIVALAWAVSQLDAAGRAALNEALDRLEAAGAAEAPVGVSRDLVG